MPSFQEEKQAVRHNDYTVEHLWTHCQCVLISEPGSTKDIFGTLESVLMEYRGVIIFQSVLIRFHCSQRIICIVFNLSILLLI